MQTYSHLLMTAALRAPLARQGIQIPVFWFLTGSVLPDIPFLLLTLAYEAWYLWISPLGPDQSLISIMEYLHFDLFFRDPVWIIGHNFFHAPLILLALGVAGWFLQRRGHVWGDRLLWFAVAAGLHALIDIGTHHSDGPLLLFPFNWTVRFPSPVSYWEPAHFGEIFGVLELVFDMALALYLFRLWRGGRRGQAF